MALHERAEQRSKEIIFCFNKDCCCGKRRLKEEDAQMVM